MECSVSAKATGLWRREESKLEEEEERTEGRREKRTRKEERIWSSILYFIK